MEEINIKFLDNISISSTPPKGLLSKIKELYLIYIPLKKLKLSFNNIVYQLNNVPVYKFLDGEWEGYNKYCKKDCKVSVSYRNPESYNNLIRSIRGGGGGGVIRKRCFFV
jgi:hypothetical protein